ncbi:MAG: GNAT family N-acetyltransferase [Cyanobacteria bacterium P01_D01_bin.56]
MEYKIEPMKSAYIDDVIEFWYEEGVILLSDHDTQEKLKTFLEYNHDFQGKELSLIAILNGNIEGTVLCGHDGRTAYLRHLAARNNNEECKKRLLNHCITGLSRTAQLECCYYFLSGDTKGERPGDDVDSLIFMLRNGWRIRSDVVVISHSARKLTPKASSLPKEFSVEAMRPSDYQDVYTLWRSDFEVLNIHSEMDKRFSFENYLEKNSNSKQIAFSQVCRYSGGGRLSQEGNDQNSRIIGAIQCGHDQRSAFVRKLVVDKSFQGNGIGTHLLNKCLESLYETEVSRVYALVGLRNIITAGYYMLRGWDMRDDLLVFYKGLGKRGGH